MKRTSLVVMAIILFITLILLGIWLLRSKTIDTPEEALDQARNFKHGNCTAVVTPAKHNRTGATYAFPSGCIPDGWEADYNLRLH